MRCSCTNPINVQDDEENHYLMSKGEFENKIATYTSGRAAEEDRLQGH